MPTDDAAAAAAPVRRTSPALLIIAWLVVGIPAAWGVTQTVKRSMDLFKSPPPPSPPPSVIAVPTTFELEATPATLPTSGPS